MEKHSQDFQFVPPIVSSIVNFIKSYSAIIKVTLSVAISYLIFIKLVSTSILPDAYELFISTLGNSNNLALYAALLLLLPVNWGTEAKKWQLLIEKVELISFLDSFKSVLIGISFNMIAPFGIGDAVSRTYFLNSKKRYEAIGSIIINRISQFIPTLIFGVASVFFIVNVSDTSLWFLTILSLVLITILILFFSTIKSINEFIQTKFNAQIKSLLNAFNYFDSTDIMKIIGLSILRYLVFSVQFLLVFFIFDINLAVHILLLGIFWIFLVKTITPGISLFSELVTREISAIFYFSFWNVGQLDISIATFIIWLVNIIIPALVGIIFIPKLKFDIDNSEDNN